MYSKKFVILLSMGWLVMLGGVVLVAYQEMQSLKSYLALANQRIEYLYNCKFEDTMRSEETLQEQRLKTHEANERHGYLLTQLRDAAREGLTASQLEGWVLRNETPDVKKPAEQLRELVEKLQKLTR
jgi:hypothetical protein